MKTTGERLFYIIRRMGEDALTYSEIIKVAETEGISKEVLDNYLALLKRTGLVYSPRPGVYKVAE